jgi:hypothetical protein
MRGNAIPLDDDTGAMCSEGQTAFDIMIGGTLDDGDPHLRRQRERDSTVHRDTYRSGRFVNSVTGASVPFTGRHCRRHPRCSPPTSAPRRKRWGRVHRHAPAGRSSLLERRHERDGCRGWNPGSGWSRDKSWWFANSGPWRFPRNSARRSVPLSTPKRASNRLGGRALSRPGSRVSCVARATPGMVAEGVGVRVSPFPSLTHFRLAGNGTIGPPPRGTIGV